jgi:DNA-binding IclR family transcriptional regulator
MGDSLVVRPQAVRRHVRIGERLPLDKDAPGKVILAFVGEKGKVYEQDRRRGYDISMGEREPEVASVAAPVFGLSWRLLGSMCISGPVSRLSQKKLEAHAKTVIAAANQLSLRWRGA